MSLGKSQPHACSPLDFCTCRESRARNGVCWVLWVGGWVGRRIWSSGFKSWKCSLILRDNIERTHIGGWGIIQSLIEVLCCLNIFLTKEDSNVRTYCCDSQNPTTITDPAGGSWPFGLDPVGVFRQRQWLLPAKGDSPHPTRDWVMLLVLGEGAGS